MEGRNYDFSADKGCREGQVGPPRTTGRAASKSSWLQAPGGRPVPSWLKGQMEEGVFGRREAWGSPSSVTSLVCRPPRGDAGPMAMVLADAHAASGGRKAGPAEVTNPDVSQKSLVSCRGLGRPLPLPLDESPLAPRPPPREIWSLHCRMACP